MSEITVHVMKYGDRPSLVMYYFDPMTGKRITRSTGTGRKKDADKAAGAWQAELRAGKYQPISNITWEAFRDRYESEVAPGMAECTGRMISTAFNSIERVLSPQRLRDLTPERLSFYQSKLREALLSEATIRTYLAHLKSALAWAVDMKLLAAVPKVKLAKIAKGSKMMKGRPIFGDEYDRMERMVEQGLLLATEERRAIRDKSKRKDSTKAKRARSEAAKAADLERNRAFARAAAPGWRRLLIGLRLSGLRLGEALNLSWDDESKIMVDLTGRRPMLRILAEHEKGGQDRMHPITPDFAEFLWATPEAERTGPVFRMAGRYDHGEVKLEWASKVISCIGKAAGVVVDRKAGKYASAHDLRRTFGEKWSKVVMPVVLQQLMRHESIDTTLRYYVGQNAESTADTVWEAASRNSNVYCNTRPEAPKMGDLESPESLTRQQT